VDTVALGQGFSPSPFIFREPGWPSRYTDYAERSGVRIPGGTINFSLLRKRPHRLGAHPASSSMGSGVLSRGKAAGE
jgi:hypothetical protein